MLLHVACYYHLLSQIHNIKLVFALGFTKTESWNPVVSKKGSLFQGRKIVFRICAFETNYNSFLNIVDVFKDNQPLPDVI